MSKDRKDIRAYKGTMKTMRTMYLCTQTKGLLTQSDRYDSVSIQRGVGVPYLEHRTCVVPEVHEDLQQPSFLNDKGNIPTTT